MDEGNKFLREISQIPKLSIPPAVMETVKEIAGTMAKHQEMVRKIMEGPLKDLTKINEAVRAQQEAFKKIQSIVRVPSMLSEAAMKSITLPRPPQERTMMFLPPTQKKTTESRADPPPNEAGFKQELVELRKAIESFTAAQEKTNALLEKAQQQQSKKARKVSSQNLILNEDAILFLEIRPKKCLDLSRAPLKKRILSLLTGEFTPTKILIEKSKAKTTQAFHKAVGELRADIVRELAIKNLLLESNSRRGYRIAPPYKFVSHLRSE